MALDTSPRERKRLARTVGVVLLIASPSLAFGSWYSTRQPLEMLAWAEANRKNIRAEDYGSAVYMASHAQRNLDEKWRPTGFATMGITGTAFGALLLYRAFRRTQDKPGEQPV